MFGQKQKISFTKFNKKNGLVDNLVYSMLQDADGYVWLCTYDGLSKYNGLDFKNYNFDPRDSLSINVGIIFKMIEHGSGTFYISSSRGFMGFNKKAENFEHFLFDPENQQSISSNWVRDLVELNDGRVLISHNQGISIYNPKEGSFLNIEPPASFGQSVDYPKLVKDDEDNIWIGTESGLFKFTVPSYSFEYVELLSEEGPTTLGSLMQDINKNIWLGTSKGLFVKPYDRSVFKPVNLKGLAFLPFVTSILESPIPGMLYIGTRTAGLIHWDIQ